MSVVPPADTPALIRVSGSSNPQSVGSILARCITAGAIPTARSVGASATNQMVKAACVAQGFIAPRGIAVTWSLGFEDIEGENGTTISAIVMRPVIR